MPPAPSHESKHVVVMTYDAALPRWPWIFPVLPEGRYELHSFGCTPSNAWERRIKRPNIPRFRMAVRAALAAKLSRAELVVSHGPRATVWTSLALRALGLHTRHLAFAFNFTELPKEPMRSIMRLAFSTVDTFVVPSTFERTLYARTFGLPLARFDMRPWGIDKPVISDTTLQRISPRPYVAAIGGEGRDYATLLSAMKLIPDIELVCVVRPHNVQGLEIPPNVKVLTNVPADVAWNVLAHAEFTVIPLLSREVPCGHVSMVAAMHYGKAIIATDSEGVSDYVRQGDNALLCPAGDARAMADRISQLMHDPALTARLGEAGKRFVTAACTERATVEYFTDYLQRSGLG